MAETREQYIARRDRILAAAEKLEQELRHARCARAWMTRDDMAWSLPTRSPTSEAVTRIVK